MPYRPGLPLDEVIRRVDPASRPRGARALWQALASGSPVPAEPGWDGFPIKGCYADAVAWVALGLARALEYVHSLGILHGDIKPANVLLTLHDGPQLLDFGLARALDSVESTDMALYGGTLPYMAPEQLEAFISLSPDLWKAVGAAADLYGLGLVLNELLTGRSPRAARPDDAIAPSCPRAARLEGGSPASRIAVGPRVPEALEAIVRHCLAFLPSDRYPDARSLVADLRRYLDLRPSSGAPSWSRERDHRNRVVPRSQWGRSRSAVAFRGRLMR